MKKSFERIFQYWAPLCALISLLIFCWGLRGEWLSSGTPAEQFQQELQQGFEKKVAALFQQNEDWIRKGVHDLPATDEFEVEYRVYRNDSLLYYSSGVAFPSVQKVKAWRQEKTPFLYSVYNSAFAAICTGNDTLTLLALLPLKVHYPIRNRYLRNQVFTAHPGKWETDDITLNPSRLEIKTHPENGRIEQLQYSFPDPEQAARPARIRALPWLFSFLFFFVLWLIPSLFRWFRSVWKVALALSLFLVLLRLSLLLPGFPGNWAPATLFSPRLLAINEWNPSPADLFLNLACLVLGISVWIRAIPISFFRRSALYFPLTVVAGGLSTGLFFFHSLQLMADNSQTAVSPERFYIFQAGDWLFFGSAALCLSLTWLFFFYVGSWYRQIKNLASVRNYLWGASLLVLLVAWIPGFPVKPLLWTTWTGLAMLALIQGMRYRLPWKFRLTFLDWLLMMLATAWVLESSLAVVFREKQDIQLIRYSSRFSEARDPLAEYLYEMAVNRIQSDQYLVRKPGRSGEGSRTLSSILLEDYFVPEFKSYSPRLFLYNQYGMRMDESMEFHPLINPWRPDPKLLVDGLPDKSLYLVPYNESELIDRIYVGRFEFFLPVYGKILGVVELYPKSASGTQIYPRLMLDENVPLQSLPEGYDFAVYLNDRLIRHAGNYDFPLIRPDASSDLMPVSDGGIIRLVRNPAPGKTLILQTYARSWVDRLISASVLFFFLGMLFLLFRIPVWVEDIPRFRKQLRNLLFVQKIRLLLIGFSLIPFLGILFVFRPYIQKSFESDTRDNIRKEIAQVSETITQEARVWLRDPGERSREELKNVLVRARELYGTDMNLYSMSGELIATTQPRVFEMGLASTRMPYPAYASLSLQHSPNTLQSEKTGSLHYWSAYQQISGPDQTPVAWLNIPYLAQQEVLDTRIRNFVSTLIQLYLLVLLVLGFLSLAFSRLLTQPLTMLRHRMERIRIGGNYEPIRYSAGDEIGDIIRSYNQMLVRLRESEETLAKTQRESAWKEMARQVAHEIKNPLTPMKLSVQHLVRAWQNRDEKWEELFNRVSQSLLQQIDSLSEIAGAFSSFASMPRPNKEILLLDEVVRNTVALYEAQEGIDLQYNTTAPDCAIEADRDQLSRALQNLIKNALQAIEEKPGFIHIHSGIQGKNIRLEIRDSGSGIPEDIQSKVFQPNFSTKNSGMGLGLAMVKRTVESMGGTIRFVTKVGEGTTFILEFPVALDPS